MVDAGSELLHVQLIFVVACGIAQLVLYSSVYI
jgi:hypothetical protein